MKTNIVQTSSTWLINKNSLESLNRVVTLCNSNVHIYIANVNMNIATIISSNPSVNALHSTAELKTVKKSFSLSSLNTVSRNQFKVILKRSVMKLKAALLNFVILDFICRDQFF
jgi:hypothetical protein